MKPFNKTNKYSKRDSPGSVNKNFSRSRDSSPSRSEGGYHRRDSGSSGRSDGEFRDTGFKLYSVTCDKCGRQCDVPFKPTGNKPVYCRTCFKEGNTESSRENFEPRGRSNDRYESRPRPRDDFEPQHKSNSGPSSEDLEKINRKLDKIMKALKIDKE